ncbi:polyprenyl synthetase family protein [Actinomyces howellii]|uniref:Octaprenyl-diphosphate synthase n=1 Tax=Actinomyces howellii TaxID=52771 RepID=A0A448HEC8_9ACTO|nr:polyprenyl synthetase family protein [Actinomyces howellii]VEG26474.1 Octaprenyl-diphosphate synthase [Actinomyces howellii]
MSNLTTTMAQVREGVDHRIAEVFRCLRERFDGPAPVDAELLEAAEDQLEGGKRMRAVLGAVGVALSAQGHERDAVLTGPTAQRLGAALELYQASALVHDDVIDAALTRRGRPATHERFAASHRAVGMVGEAALFGRSAAILAGDLLLSVAGAEMGAAGAAHVAGGGSPDHALAAREAFDDMTAEVAVGQFLDVRSQVEHLPDPGQDPVAAGEAMRRTALRVVRHKSARYSVMHPLLIGALLGGVPAHDPRYRALRAFGEATGVAFQLRDDVLGIFGDPEVTGKPAGDDLREGKRTVLVALAWQRADAPGRRLLAEVLSDPRATPDQVDRAAALIEGCGALGAVEEEIDTHLHQGLRALESAGSELDAATVQDLHELSVLLTSRRA